MSILGKIRHFYDLYFLLFDEECKMYIESDNFKDDFNKLFEHDKSIFSDPKGWTIKTVNQSPLIVNFDSQWKSLKTAYNRELQKVAFSKTPEAKEIKNRIKPLQNKLLE